MRDIRIVHLFYKLVTTNTHKDCDNTLASKISDFNFISSKILRHLPYFFKSNNLFGQYFKIIELILQLLES